MEFRKFKIGNLCNVSSSKRIYLSEYEENGVPFYRGKEIIELSEKKDISNKLYISEDRYSDIKNIFGVPNPGDILMTGVGTLGKTWMVDNRKFYFKDGNLIWFYNFKNQISSKYLIYVFKSKKFQNIIEEICIGTTQKAITIKQIKEIELKVPNIKFQNQIVKILDIIDEKIELNNQINDNLHEMIKEIYLDYLEQLGTESLEINIKEVFDFETGFEPGSKEYLNYQKENTIKFYRVGDMLSNCTTYINRNLPKMKQINDEDIIVSFDGTLGRISYGLKGAFSSGIKRIRITNKYNKIIDTSFVYAYFTNDEIQKLINEHARGTTILHASSSIEFMKFKLDYNNIKKYNRNISKLFRKMLSIKKQNQTLTQLRDTLLPKLMNGEIDLENIQI